MWDGYWVRAKLDRTEMIQTPLVFLLKAWYRTTGESIFHWWSWVISTLIMTIIIPVIKEWNPREQKVKQTWRFQTSCWSSARFETKTCQSHSACDDLSGLVSLLIHLTPSKPHWLRQTSPVCPCREPCPPSVLNILYFFTFSEVQCLFEAVWASFEPLFLLLIHQSVGFIYLFTVFCAARHSSPCSVHHPRAFTFTLNWGHLPLS